MQHASKLLLSLSVALRTANLGGKDDCRMLTNIPVKDHKNCPAVATSLSCLIGVIVPGTLRKVDTVFEVIGLQVMGITSVRRRDG